MLNTLANLSIEVPCRYHHPPVTKDQQHRQFNKSDTTAPATAHKSDTSPLTSIEGLIRDRPIVSGNPRNIGAVAEEPGSHPIIMAENLDNDHNSDLENRTPHKNVDVTPNDTSQPNKDKNSPSTGVEYQRKAERDLRREVRRRRELEDKLLMLEADLKAKTTRSSHEDSPRKDQDPFTKEITKAKILKDFKHPDMTPYDGISDPSHHLSNFRSRMYLTDASDVIRCKAFLTILTKTAIKWFDNLPPRPISSFDNLAKKFLARFSIQKDKTKHTPSLLGIKQGDREILRSYMERFNKICLDIQSLPTEVAIMGVINGV
ncbi:hypothetical protein AHAS_Ahas13G0364600 [Arachis hypogaea]